MRKKTGKIENPKGTAVIIVVFAIALMTVLVVGILQLNTEELQMMQNQVSAAQARYIAEAGINRAFAELRNDRNWDDGFSSVNFENQGTYSVSVIDPSPAASSDIRIASTAKSDAGFIATMNADISMSWDAPYRIRIDTLQVNE